MVHRLALWFVGFILLAQPARQAAVPTPLERLQAKVDVVAVNNLTLRLISGQFNHPDEPILSDPHIGSVSLFLFPDGTYIYTQRADLPPETIYDKGTWAFEGSAVSLRSDKDVTWKPEYVEREYVLVRRRGHDGEIFAVGTKHSLVAIEQQAKDDPQRAFLRVSLKQDRIINEAEYPAIKAKLMKEKWKPELYR